MSCPTSERRPEAVNDERVVSPTQNVSTKEKRRSFVDQLSPSQQKALFQHQNNLMLAQNARWNKKQQQEREKMKKKSSSSSSRDEARNALDDTLLDLQVRSFILYLL